MPSDEVGTTHESSKNNKVDDYPVTLSVVSNLLRYRKDKHWGNTQCVSKIVEKYVLFIRNK